jgi:hypothetical protein
MKYVLVNIDAVEFGAFNNTQKVNDGYVCDNSIYYTSITGEITQVKEVADDYMTPDQIEGYNTKQSASRAAAYPTESDPIFFQWQRGQKTEQEWLDAVATIHAQYPYK